MITSALPSTRAIKGKGCRFKAGRSILLAPSYGRAEGDDSGAHVPIALSLEHATGDGMVDKVTVLPPAGRREMFHRMIHGTNPRTGKPNKRRTDPLGRRIAKSNAAPIRRVRAKRRVVYVAR